MRNLFAKKLSKKFTLMEIYDIIFSWNQKLLLCFLTDIFLCDISELRKHNLNDLVPEF